MLIVVLPVFALMFYFIWKYRADNVKATYTPDWDDNRTAEYIWWGLPFVIILAISILTCIKTVQLDPFKPLQSSIPPLKIQAVALQWKWLFIYPQQGVASLNFVQFPHDVPLHFEITADAPMNSFWIPQLGGQIYAMPSMKTELHLIAHEAGHYRGSSANISGKGFAGMHFMAQATTEEEFAQWVGSAKESKNVLDIASYIQLAKPSENEPVSLYQLKEEQLFDQILMKYMAPSKETKIPLQRQS
jgi:cytochrome o ubiquinol oxidase subunit 2